MFEEIVIVGTLVEHGDQNDSDEIYTPVDNICTWIKNLNRPVLPNKKSLNVIMIAKNADCGGLKTNDHDLCTWQTLESMVKQKRSFKITMNCLI